MRPHDLGFRAGARARARHNQTAASLTPRQRDWQWNETAHALSDNSPPFQPWETSCQMVARPSGTKDVFDFSNKNFVAFFKVEFARGEDGDRIDALDLFRDPQVRDAGFVKLVAQPGKIEIYRTEKHERLTFGLVSHAHNRNRALIFSGKIEQIDNFLLDRLVWHHFAADFRKAGKSPFDIKKSVLIESANVTRLQPAITQHFCGPFRFVQITFEYVSPAQPKHPSFM